MKPSITLLDRLAVLSVMAGVGFVSLLPPDRLPPVGGAMDEILHAGLYALLAFAICRAGREAFDGTAALAIAAATVFGGGMELLQSLVGRDPSLTDLAADVLGAVVGAGVWELIAARETRREPSG